MTNDETPKPERSSNDEARNGDAPEPLRNSDLGILSCLGTWVFRHSSYLLVLLCFFLSGLAALLYQVVWMRCFSVVFGTSELAIVTVLCAYMSGLALGAAVIARWNPNFIGHPADR